MKVTAISWTPNPLRVIAAQQKNMRGGMIHDIDSISDEEARRLFEDVIKTRLRGALEFVDFVFQIEGVTRAFTHQLVRNRVSSFSQESLRFTVKESFQYRDDTKKPGSSELVSNCMKVIQDTYNKLLENGETVEDARGVLPTNVLTKIGYKVNYRSLFDTAEVRLCHQSQGEFRQVMEAMKQEVGRIEPLLAKHLQPACTHSGSCEFGSLWDRPCPLQKRYPIRVSERV